MSVAPSTLHLDSGVEDPVLIAFAYPVDVPDCFVPEVRSYVASEDVLTTGELPAMKVVDFLYSIQTLNVIVKLNCINIGWGSFHHDLHAVEEDGHGS